MSEIDAIAAALPAYEIGGEIGRGGWGVVLAGQHRQLQRQVAIKELPSAFAAQPAVRARFTSEARLLASLDHPHVVPVYDFVEQDGLCVLVMEMLPGGSVWSRFSTSGFSAPDAVAVALACTAGLKAAHDRGILHRDIKPENLMFGATGTLKVTDFGIAKMIGGAETLATRAGEVLGTPAYMAPEQARGGALTPATDVYAVATMLYELLAGVLPFSEGSDAMALLFSHAFEAPVPLLDVAPGVPAPLAAVVMRGLATDAADRYPSAEAFGVALSEASSAVWGPDWLQRQGIPVLGADSMTRPTAPAPPTVQTDRPVAFSDRPAAVTVRPGVTVRAPAVELASVSAADLVPVRKVVAARPVVPAVAALVLAVCAVLVALVGLGAPSRGGDLPAGSITVAGHSIAGSRVALDLTKPVAVAVSGGPAADEARLSIDVLGVKVRSVTAPVRAVGGRSVAELPALGGQYLLGGNVSAKVELLRQRKVVGSRGFGARTTQSAFATAFAVADVLLLLFAIAYVESLLRSLRRYRSRVTGVAGLPVFSVLLAVGVVGLSWVVAGREPTVGGLVASGALAAIGGAAASVSALRVGRRRRGARAGTRRAAR